MEKLEFHHTGVLVESIETALIHYTAVFGEENISEIFTVDSQKVKVCFVKNGKDSYLELVEPINESSVVYKMLKKRIQYYHIAYKVQNIEKAISFLESLNYKSLGTFNSEAFSGNLCGFLFSPNAELIELIEE